MKNIKLYYLNKTLSNEESELKVLYDNREYWSHELTENPRNREIFNKVLHIMEEITDKEKLLYDLYIEKCILENNEK
jgi:hypothetical protein